MAPAGPLVAELGQVHVCSRAALQGLQAGRLLRPWPCALLLTWRQLALNHPPPLPPPFPTCRREGGAKRDRGAEGSESEDDGGDGGAPSAGRRARGAAAADADAAAPMETDDAVAAAAEAADEPISDAEEEAPAAAEQGSLTEDAAAAVRRAVTEVGQHGDACSLTGVKAVLAAQGVHLSSDEILSVLSDLHAAEVIMLDGTEFYLSV